MLAASLPTSHGGLSGPPALSAGPPVLSAAPPVLSAALPQAHPAPTANLPRRAGISPIPEFSLQSDPPPVADEDWSFADPVLDAPRAPPGGVSRAAGGGASFGEVSLGDDQEAAIGQEAISLQSGSLPPASGEDDMEFGGIPQEAEVGRSGAPALAPAPAPSRKPADQVAPASIPKPRVSAGAGKVVAGALALLAVGGASLEVLTPYGAFGRHIVFDALNADKFAALQMQAIDGARKLLANDTFGNTNQAIGLVDAAHGKSPRVTGLLAYGAFVGYIAELRYGRGPTIDAHAKQQLAQIPPEKTPPYADLARAAEAAVESQLPRAKQIALSLAQRDKQDVDVAILAGEVELLVKEPEKALDHFTRAATLDGGAPRSSFGIARANAALGKHETSLALAKKVLQQSPQHVGARLLIARSLWTGSRNEAAATAILGEVISPGPTREAASPLELVDALTTMARVHMARSRMSQAETSLTEALKIDPKAGPALAGMGELLYREGRFTDALARFEAGIQADPEGTSAKIGAAKTKIALERLGEAKEQLKRLRDARPNDLEATYWIGRVEEALGDKAAAERAYGEAITLAGGKPDAIDAYVSLSQLLASQGRPGDAQTKLAEAKKTLPPSATIFRAIADVDLGAGRYDTAREGYEAALKVDPEDLAARFKLGVTLRRMNRFDLAHAEFDKVAALDKEYPGLALERGLLYESNNRAREALEFYQQALAKAPDDPDMMLRVGSAEVVSGHASQAEDMLRKVIAKRPNSAEVNHYLGRALLLKGTNLAEALRYLKRAVEIDSNRAEFHLYVGWAANEAGQPAVAQDELTKALELDRGLADAYWQKGVMQRKEGAVIDAMKNLQKALELRPSRFEAYATLAECYEDENRTGEAITAWRRAISSDGSRPEWHYRLGKLLGRGGESELREAVTLSEATEGRPGWLAQAYFDLGELERAGGRRADAVAHLRRFLALAKVDSPYRGDARKALTALGAAYEDGPQ
jgi:tetratricopeptide (TPR) repeat protein